MKKEENEKTSESVHQKLNEIRSSTPQSVKDRIDKAFDVCHHYDNCENVSKPSAVAEPVKDEKCSGSIETNKDT